MKLTIRKWDVFEDFYVIERAEVDGRNWNWDEDPIKRSRVCGAAFRDTPDGFTSDIEGSAFEMLQIACAIVQRDEESFKRCSVDARRELVLIGSPRNDGGAKAMVTYEEADDLARQIIVMLGS